MNADRLHALVLMLSSDLEQTNLVELFNELSNSISNEIAQPHPNHQAALGESLNKVRAALTNSAVNEFSPAWHELLSEIGCSDIFGSPLLEQLNELFGRNQITLAIAQEQITDWTARLTALQEAFIGLHDSLEVLKIGSEKLEPGECEIGFLIPRKAVDSRLDEFANELREFDFIFGTLAEIATGKRDEFQIRTISSSDLTVILDSAPCVAALVATALERVIAVYKQLLEIRKLHADLQTQSVPDSALKGVSDHANSMMERGISKISTDLIKMSDGSIEPGRKNELKNALKISLNKLANRIDRGFNVEVRAEPPIPELGESTIRESDDALPFQRIAQASEQLKFMNLDGEPILNLPESKPS